MDAVLKDALRSLAGLNDENLEGYGDNEQYLMAHLQDIEIRPVAESTVETLLNYVPDNDELSAYNTYLFLPPPEDGDIRIPVLNVLYDDQQTSFQVACFFLRGDDVHAVGYRFESHEAPGDDDKPSMHSYMHAQPSNAIRRRDETRTLLLPVAEPHLPDGEPAMPLPARDATDLLVCLLVSLYGRHQALQILQVIDDPRLTGRMGAILGE